MKDEIKKILDLLNFNRDTISNGTCRVEDFMSREQIIKFLDYITNLQEENEKLKKIAKKMHLWIFLHTGDEQKIYDEIGLTDEENTMLGYSGQFRLQGEDKDE